MKKLLFFAFALSTIFCILTMTVFAAEPSSSNEFGEVTLITDNDGLNNKNDCGYSEGDTSRVVLQIPGTETYVTYPAYYVLDLINKDGGIQGVENFSYINAATGYEFDATSVIRLEFPNVVEKFSSNYFHIGNMTNIKYVKFGSNMDTVFGFARNASIETVVFEDNTDAEATLSIAKGAFENCSALATIDLPVQLTSIGERAFASTPITTIELSSKLEVVGVAAFLSCKQLQTVVIPEDNAIREVAHRAFDECYALTGTMVFQNVTTIGTYAFRNCAKNEGCALILEFPSIVTLGGTSGDTHVFSYSPGIKEIYLGANLKDMSFNTFTNCTGLETVVMAGVDPSRTTFPSYTFEGCTALKSFCIPEGITALPNRMFKNCTSLTAVYLPTTLTAINSGANDHATFKDCTSLYFVNEPFGRGEIPAEPEIYYFPSGLVTIKDEAFDGSRLNNIVVLPKGVTSLTQGYTFEGCTSASGKPTVVFMGDMETVNVRNWGVSKIFFANSADVDAASAGLTGSLAAVFCFADGNTEHLTEKHMASEATCTLPKIEADFCFCGQFIPGTETTEGDPLGHNNATIVGYAYVNYMEKGVCSSLCDRCGNVIDSEAEALFNCLGISAKTFGDDIGLVQGYAVNRAAIEAYKVNTEGFNFGVIAYANVDGTEIAPKPGDDKVVDIVFDNMANDHITVMVTGIPEDYKDSAIVLCIYVKDKGGFYYLNGGVTSETVVGNSYNEVVGNN